MNSKIVRIPRISLKKKFRGVPRPVLKRREAQKAVANNRKD